MLVTCSRVCPARLPIAMPASPVRGKRRANPPAALRQILTYRPSKHPAPSGCKSNRARAAAFLTSSDCSSKALAMMWKAFSPHRPVRLTPNSSEIGLAFKRPAPRGGEFCRVSQPPIKC